MQIILMCTQTSTRLCILSQAENLTQTGQRWINEMTDYHFYIHYKPGTENKVADSLSRFPIQSQIDMSEYKEIVHDEEIKAVFRYACRRMLAESADMKKEDRRQLPHEACVLL